MPELPVNPAWEVHPTEVKSAIDDGDTFLLLDVRRPDEHARAKIPNSVLIPLHELDARIDAEIPQWKSKCVIVYCHHGARSLRATALLRNHGFQNAHSMAGGIDAYSLLADPSTPRY